MTFCLIFFIGTRFAQVLLNHQSKNQFLINSKKLKMRTVHHNPFIGRSFSGLLEDLFTGNAPRFFRDEHTADEWLRYAQPPVNVKETETGYFLEVFAPGVRKEDLKLNINDKTLTISFEQKEEEKQEAEKWIRSEFKVRSFKRSFTLGDKIDTDKISASFENGILILSLPKREAAIVTNKVIDVA